MKLPLRLASCIALVSALAVPTAFGATDIELWHSMDGAAGQQLGRIADDFNSSQSAYRVVPAFKGSSREAFDAGLAAQRSGHGPHILQVDDSLRGKAASLPRAFTPVYQVLQQARETLSASAFVPVIANESLDQRGRLLSLPFDSSTPVLYYNRDAFTAAGLDPDKAPRTWLKVQEAALKVVDSETAPCGFTTDQPAWVHMENLLAWHNEPFASVQNGPRGKEVRLVFNTRLMILHVGLLSSWVHSGLFRYFGRGKEGEQKFAAGECAMLTGSSGSIADIQRKAKFHVGVGAMPLYEDFPAAPSSALPGGGSLWVMAGKKKPEYVGVGKFLAYVSRPAVQAEWHQATGYLPTTEVAFKSVRKEGYPERHPGAEVALNELSGDPGARAKMTRFEQASAIRSIVDDELEAAWTRRKTPKDAVDAAVERGNQFLRTLLHAPKGK